MEKEAYILFRDTLFSLDEKAKRALLNELRQNIFGPDEYPRIDEMTRELRDRRFPKGIVCPRCGSNAVQRHGTYKSRTGASRQRYLCKGCSKTFTDLTGTPMAGTHYPDKWVRYCECMVSGMSLAATAEELYIHHATAFYWRHKILTAMRRGLSLKLDGIVEADETYYLEAMKGKNVVKTLGLREPRKRGGVAKKRGISREQVCVLVLMDRNRQILAKVAGRGKITHQELESVVGPHLGDVKSDAATSFRTFARKRGIEHEVVNASQGERVRGIYHVQTVNSYHRRLREWLYRFNGVSTKYFDNYLFWHQYLDRNRRVAVHQKKMGFVWESSRNPVIQKTYYFRPGLYARM